MITLAGLALTLALASGPVTPFTFCEALLKVSITDTEVEVFDQMCLTDVADDTADGPEE